MTGTTLDDLVGEVVTGFSISKYEEVFEHSGRIHKYAAKDVVIIETADHTYNLEVHGDCCSASWWAEFRNISALVGNKVVSVESVDYTPTFTNRYQEEDEGYGIEITLQPRGEKWDVFAPVFLGFVNSSNGYYGGWMGCKKVKKGNGNNPGNRRRHSPC